MRIYSKIIRHNSRKSRMWQERVLISKHCVLRWRTARYSELIFFVLSREIVREVWLVWNSSHFSRLEILLSGFCLYIERWVLVSFGEQTETLIIFLKFWKNKTPIFHTGKGISHLYIVFFHFSFSFPLYFISTSV